MNEHIIQYYAHRIANLPAGPERVRCWAAVSAYYEAAE